MADEAGAADANRCSDTFVRTMVGGGMRPEYAALLRKHQRAACKRMYAMIADRVNGVFLALDMGLGKSVVSLCMACIMRNPEASIANLNRASIIVCPKATVHAVWAHHVATWTTLSHHVISSSKKAVPQGADVYIITYEMLVSLYKRACGGEPRIEIRTRKGKEYKRRIWERVEGYVCPVLDRPYNAVIYDEVHYARNGSSNRNKGAAELTARFKIGASGTPFNNKPEEIHAVCKVLGIESDKQAWMAMGSKLNKPVVEAFRRKYMIRVTKETLRPPLPPCTESNVAYELVDREAYVYNRYLVEAQEAAAMIRKNDMQSIQRFTKALTKLTQSLFHPLLPVPREQLPAEELIPRCVAGPSSKMVVLASAIDRLLLTQTKVVVTAHHTLQLRVLRAYMESLGHGPETSVYYADQMSDAQSSEALRLFMQPDNGVRVIYLGLGKGGVGLNLAPAGEAVVFAGLWYNKYAMMQVRDRIHRIGQQRPVFAEMLFCPDTVEATILKMHEDKLRAGSAIVDGNYSSMDDTSEWKQQLGLVRALQPKPRI